MHRLRRTLGAANTVPSAAVFQVPQDGIPARVVPRTGTRGHTSVGPEISMPEMTSVEKAVKAAFERGHDINLHHYPIRLEFDITMGALTLEGEVENIIAKKRAFEIDSQVGGVQAVL